MAKSASITTCVLVLVYFAFTSGMVFEVLHSSTVGAVDLPYSVALSGDRLSIVGIFDEDDVACAKWLADNKGDIPIDADYNSARLLVGSMRSLKLNDFVVQPSGERYLFLSSWNVRHQAMVVGLRPALRGYASLPSLNGSVISFKKGNAVIYYFKE